MKIKMLNKNCGTEIPPQLHVYICCARPNGRTVRHIIYASEKLIDLVAHSNVPVTN